MFRLLLIASLLLTASPIFSKTITVDTKRLVSIIGTVDGTTIGKADELLKLVNKSKDDVWIHLNSPGGYVDAGLIFIDTMNIARSRGVTLNCVSTMLAASMAFNIMAYCDNVYALPNTMLLFHPARIASPSGLTAKDLNYYGQELARLESKMQPVLRDMIGMDEDFFLMHYEMETMWNATDLASLSRHGWLTIIEDVKGLDNNFHKVKRQHFFFRSTYPELIIITERKF